MIHELSDDENVRIMVDNFGASEAQARFIIAIERDEISGDVIAVDGPLSAAQKRKVGIGRRIRFEPIAENA